MTRFITTTRPMMPTIDETNTSAPPIPPAEEGGRTDAQNELEELVASSGAIAKRLETEILLLQHDIMKDYRLNTEVFAKTGACFAKMMDAGYVRTYKELNMGKGMFASHVHGVELNNVDGLDLTAKLKEMRLKRVPLNIKGCAWTINFKLDQFCTGDILREANAILDYMLRVHAASAVPLSSDCFEGFLGLEPMPHQFYNSENLKGHASLGFGNITEHCFATGIEWISLKESGYGIPRFFGVDVTDESAKKVFIKNDGGRAALADHHVVCVLRSIYAAGFDKSEFDNKTNGVAVDAIMTWLLKVSKKCFSSLNVTMTDSFNDRNIGMRIFKASFAVPIMVLDDFDAAVSKLSGMQYKMDGECEGECVCKQLGFKSATGISRKISIIDSFDVIQEVKNKFYKDDARGGNRGEVTEIKQLLEDNRQISEEMKINAEKIIKVQEEVHSTVKDAKKVGEETQKDVEGLKYTANEQSHSFDHLRKMLEPLCGLAALQMNPKKSPELMDLTTPAQAADAAEEGPPIAMAAGPESGTKRKKKKKVAEPVVEDGAIAMDDIVEAEQAEPAVLAARESWVQSEFKTAQAELMKDELDKDEPVYRVLLSPSDALPFGPPVVTEEQDQKVLSRALNFDGESEGGNVASTQLDWCRSSSNRHPAARANLHLGWSLMLIILTLFAPCLRAADGNGELVAASAAAARPQVVGPCRELSVPTGAITGRAEVKLTQQGPVECEVFAVAARGGFIMLFEANEACECFIGGEGVQPPHANHESMQRNARPHRRHLHGASLCDGMRVICDGALHEGGLLEVRRGQRIGVDGAQMGDGIEMRPIGGLDALDAQLHAQLHALLLSLVQQTLWDDTVIRGWGTAESPFAILVRAWFDGEALKKVLLAVQTLKFPVQVQSSVLFALREAAMVRQQGPTLGEVERLRVARELAEAGVLKWQAHAGGHTFARKTTQAQHLYDLLETANESSGQLVDRWSDDVGAFSACTGGVTQSLNLWGPEPLRATEALQRLATKLTNGSTRGAEPETGKRVLEESALGWTWRQAAEAERRPAMEQGLTFAAALRSRVQAHVRAMELATAANLRPALLPPLPELLPAEQVTQATPQKEGGAAHATAAGEKEGAGPNDARAAADQSMQVSETEPVGQAERDGMWRARSMLHRASQAGRRSVRVSSADATCATTSSYEYDSDRSYNTGMLDVFGGSDDGMPGVDSGRDGEADVACGDQEMEVEGREEELDNAEEAVEPVRAVPWEVMRQMITATREEVSSWYNGSDGARAYGASATTSFDFTPGSIRGVMDAIGELKDGDKVLWIGPANGPEILAIARHCTGVTFLAMEIQRNCVQTLQRVAAERGIDNIEVQYQNILYVSSDCAKGATHVFTTHIAAGASGAASIRSEFAEKVLYLARGKRLVMLKENWSASKKRSPEDFLAVGTVTLEKSSGGELCLKSRGVLLDEGSCINESIARLTEATPDKVQSYMKVFWYEETQASDAKPTRVVKRNVHPVVERQAYFMGEHGIIAVTAGLNNRTGNVNVWVMDLRRMPEFIAVNRSSVVSWRYPLGPGLVPKELRKHASDETMLDEDDELEHKDGVATALRKGRDHLGFSVIKLPVEKPVLTLAGIIKEAALQRSDKANPCLMGATRDRAIKVSAEAGVKGTIRVTTGDRLRCGSGQVLGEQVLTLTTSRTAWPVIIEAGEAPFKLSIADAMDLMWGRPHMKHVKEFLLSKSYSFAITCIGNALCFRSIEVFMSELAKYVKRWRSDRGGVVELFAGVGTGAEAATVVFAGQKVVYSAESNSTLQKLLKERYPEANVVGDLNKQCNQEAIPRKGRIMIVCFPCKPFGNLYGTSDAKRRNEGIQLVQSLIEAILASGGYDIIILENVPGMLKVHEGDEEATYTSLTRWLGHRAEGKYIRLVGLQNALDHGVNMRRERIFWGLVSKEVAYASGEPQCRKEGDETRELDARGDFKQVRADGILPGVVPRAGQKPKFDKEAHEGARLRLPIGVQAGGKWNDIHVAEDGRTWWCYDETASHGHGLGRRLVWQYFEKTRQGAAECWALMFVVAEDIGLWEAGAPDQRGLYLVLGEMPDRTARPPEEEGWLELKRVECATYEGDVLMRGKDEAQVEQEGRKKAADADCLGYCMLVRYGEVAAMVNAKGQPGSHVQMCNSTHNTSRSQNLKFVRELGGKAFLDGHCKPITDLRDSDMTCREAALYTDYGPDFFNKRMLKGVTENVKEPAGARRSVEAETLWTQGRVVFKGWAAEAMRHPDVRTAVEKFDFKTADRLNILQPDGLRRIRELRGCPEFERANAVVKEVVMRVLANLCGGEEKVEQERWDAVNEAVVATAPGAKTQSRHKDESEKGSLSIIVAGTKRKVLFQKKTELPSPAEDSYKQIEAEELEEGDVLVFLSEECHGGSGRRHEEYHVRGGPSCKNFFDIPIDRLDWMIHYYAAKRKKRVDKLDTFPCELHPEDFDEDVIRLLGSVDKRGEDVNCLVCQGALEEEDNAMVICDGRYDQREACNRVCHIRCAGLGQVPHGKWLCQVCDERGRQTEKEEMASAAKGGKRLRPNSSMRV